MNLATLLNEISPPFVFKYNFYTKMQVLLKKIVVIHVHISMQADKWSKMTD